MTAAQPLNIESSSRTARYELSVPEQATRTRLLFARYAKSIDAATRAGKNAMLIAVDAHDELADLGRTIEQERFADLADNLPPEAMEREYGPYDDRSIFYLGVDLVEKEVVAAMRIITGTVGIGPPVKSIRDAIHHPGYLALQSDLIDLRDHPTGPLLDLRNAEEESAGTSQPVDTDLPRREIEDHHNMKPGRLVVDIATIASRVRGMRVAVWTTMGMAATVRLSNLLDVDYCVTFATTDMISATRRATRTPWINLAGRPPVAYIEGDQFLSQPAFLDVRRYRTELANGYRELEASRSIGYGPAFDRLSTLSFAEKEDCRFLLQPI